MPVQFEIQYVAKLLSKAFANGDVSLEVSSELNDCTDHGTLDKLTACDEIYTGTFLVVVMLIVPLPRVSATEGEPCAVNFTTGGVCPVYVEGVPHVNVQSHDVMIVFFAVEVLVNVYA